MPDPSQQGTSESDMRALAAACLILSAGHLALRLSGLSLDDLRAADFMSFYAAGHLADGPQPWLAYSLPAHLAAERSFQAGASPPHTVFLYPPTGLLPYSLLALQPYWGAFCTWLALQVAVLAAALRLAGLGWVAAACCLAFPSFLQSMAMGQNTMLTVALIVAAVALLDRGRSVAAGAMLGLLCYKPHLALAVPVALAASREWRAMAAAAATSAAMALLSVAAFGAGTWRAWFEMATSVPSTYSTKVPLDMLASPFAAAAFAGLPHLVAGSIQACAATAAGVVAWMAWSRCGRGDPARPLSLAAAVALAQPVFMFYDIGTAVAGLAFLLPEANRHTLSRADLGAAAAAFVLAFMAGLATVPWWLPPGPAVGCLLLWRASVRIPARSQPREARSAGRSSGGGGSGRGA